MNYRIHSLLLLAFISCAFRVNAEPALENFRHNTIIQDPTTKVDYYIESDRRHVAAISLDGRVLWCCEIIPQKWEGKMFILKIHFEKLDSSSSGEDCIGVSIWRGGQGGGRLDEKTGVYTDSGKAL